MSKRPYENVGLDELYQEQEDAKAAALMCKNTLAEIEAELALRFAGMAASLLAGDAGTKYPGIDGAYRVKAEAKKDVTWNSDALLRLALSMPYSEARATFDIAVKIKERVYAGLTGKMRADAEAARIVEIKPPKFTIEKKDTK